MYYIHLRGEMPPLIQVKEHLAWSCLTCFLRLGLNAWLEYVKDAGTIT